MLEMSSDPQAVSIPKCTATGHRNFEMIEDEDDTTTNLWCTSSKRTTICRMAQLLPNFAAVVDSRCKYCKYSPLLEPQQQKRFFLKRIPPHPRILLLLLLASLMAFLLWNMIHFEEGIPPFNRWAFSNTTLDCARLMADDTEYIAEMATQRIQFEDPPKLEMDCEKGIRWRNFFPDIESGEQYPLAQARIVYRDYVFLEMELASTYSPNNWYCYAIDVKADATFRSRMRQLAGCLPNVLILPQTWNFDSGGHNISRAHLACLQLLTVPERGWKYVALLQNHDTAIKTNAQMKQIYQWLDGANDVEVTHLPAGRVSDTLDWSFEAIRMFKNESRNRKASASGFAQKLVFSKGYVQSSLTREMAEFMLNDLDLTVLVQRLENGGFGIDEILVPTLHAADALQAPGGFTHACLEKDKRVQHITRASIWYDENACGSKHLRHHVCVFGLEDLPQHLAKWPHLFANKFQPDFDFGAALCWYQAMHNRSYLPAESERAMLSLSRAVYADLAHVRFQHFKALMAEQQTEIGGTNKMSYKQALQSFDCSEEYDNLNGR